MKSNFKKLDHTKHMLEWFSTEPYAEILESVEQMYIKQEASTKLLAFNVVSEAQWLTGARKSEDTDKVILVRAGVAFLSEFTLKDNNGTYHLKGVFTWVARGLDAEAKQQKWMELDGTLEEFGSKGILNDRIYIED
jgi:hypothetical protein